MSKCKYDSIFSHTDLFGLSCHAVLDQFYKVCSPEMYLVSYL